MERQRLVDRPDAAAGLALADGRERRRGSPSGGGRSRRTRPRPPTSPLRSSRRATPANDASPATIRSAPSPRPRRGRRDAQRVRDVVRPGRRQADRDRAAELVEADELDGRAVARRRGHPAEEHARRTGCRRELLRDAPGVAPGAGSPRRPRSRRPRSSRASRRGAPRPAPRPGSPTFATRTGGSATGPRPHAPDPALERVDDGVLVGEDVGVVPLRGGEDRERRPVRVEVAGVLVGLDDERGVRPAAMRRRRSRRYRSRSSAPTNAVGSRPPSARTWTSQPEVVLLPWVPATPTRSRPRRRVRDDLLPRLERDAEPPGRLQLGVVRGDRGQGLRHREPVRGDDAGPGDVGRVVLPGHRRGRRRRGPSCTARGHPGRSRSRRRPPRPARTRRGARSRAGGAQDVDPLPRPDRPRVAGRREAGADGRGLGHPREPALAVAPTRSSEQLEDRGRARRPCSRPGRRSRRDAGPRRRRRRPRRRTSARPASPRSRRRVRRSR